MKLSILASPLATCLLFASAHASASYRYELTLTNGSAMPISPAAIFVKNGQEAAARVGQSPTMGFTQLCQTGSPSGRVAELQMNRDMTYVTQTMAPLMPGESRSIEVDVQDPAQQSIHFESMYGKSKDLCAVGAINGHTLVALAQHVTTEYSGRDEVLATGAFTDPALPMTDYLDPAACKTSKDAVSCLRALSMPTKNPAKIRFFSAYLPGLVKHLETKFGAAETQTLLLPSSGAVRVTLKLKH